MILAKAISRQQSARGVEPDGPWFSAMADG